MRTILWFEKLKEGDQSKDLGVDGKVILKWILGERMGGRGLDLLGSKRGSYEHGNRPKDFAP